MDLSAFAAYIALGILGLVRWASWLVRRVPAALYRPARTGHFEPLAIVVPVYQESPRVFRQALESSLANDVLEVICVIGETDTACMRIARRYPVRVISQTVVGKAVSCLSGRTAVYRRSLLLRHSERFMNETFLGVPCMSGDDKRLTTLVLEGGHCTVLQRSARVWSSFPRDGRTFFRQRLRWSRNTWRSDLRALGSRWLWRRGLHLPV